MRELYFVPEKKLKRKFILVTTEEKVGVGKKILSSALQVLATADDRVAVSRRRI